MFVNWILRSEFRDMVLMTILLNLLFVFGGSLASEPGHHWGYREHTGPENWPKTCQDGFRQSPIDIRAADTDYALLHRMHFVHYDHAGPLNISNNGHTIIGNGFDQWGLKQPYIQGAGLRHRYRLVQFHYHWAQHDHLGSEHKIGGLHYPGEIHLVHVRHDLTVAEAVKRPDGIAVVGVFLLIGHDSGPNAAVSSVLNDVVYPGNRSALQGFRVRPLLPPHTEAFYRYEGSLTTPGCDEAVIWTVLADPISITRTQIKEFRQVHSDEGGRFTHNYRPVQPLNGRRILYRPSSFDKTFLCSGHQATSILVVFADMITKMQIR
ncbi:unnamed protein product [Cylicocyclus nassatus]|uniref:Carbonic anhydrase n=1 Tax=Cylicocyclus nassatus TaxID=53992 RepID=A0AA36HF65_CYLNA|nr:unnamed protein product [Cylicocyclus nassatus]